MNNGLEDSQEALDNFDLPFSDIGFSYANSKSSSGQSSAVLPPTQSSLISSLGSTAGLPYSQTHKLEDNTFAEDHQLAWMKDRSVTVHTFPAVNRTDY